MLLLVEDDESLLKNLKKLLSRKYEVDCANNLNTAFELLNQKKYSMIISDFKIGNRNGLELLEKINNFEYKPLFILITAYPDWEIALESMKKGAFDCLAKPFEFSQLEAIITRGFKFFQLKNENINLKSTLKNNNINIIGKSSHIQEVLSFINKVSAADSTILITGETGTGKELVAREIHNKSKHSDNSFIAINCGAIPENLIETEIFGYVEGAFTGAINSKMGAIELAENGTLFLDEISEMPFNMQVKLLRVLEGQPFRRVGGVQDIIPKIRIIAATNKNLQILLKENKFRQDLYYRLSVLQVELKPLRERKEDIESITKFYIELFNKKFNKKIKGIETDALQLLMGYNWPGNIRELVNVIERTVLLCDDDMIKNVQLYVPTKKMQEKEYIINIEENIDLSERLEKIEKIIIEKYLKYFDYNQNQTAKALNLSRQNLKYKLEKYNIVI